SLVLYTYLSFCLLLFFLLILPPPPRSTLFPYTTLFRSDFTDAKIKGVQKSNILASSNVFKAISGPIPLRSPMEIPTIIFSFLLIDRKSTRLNSSHVKISYAVFCLKKKKKKKEH